MDQWIKHKQLEYNNSNEQGKCYETNDSPASFLDKPIEKYQ